ncbi:uncharacterized protein LOC108458693 [Gossypium arboreum]|uniref:uncharacterized protein LOC108458693 n=1 Tax=Gossypium arboreum TaxID=29729 RepID=UPI0008192BB0|nr:uncharacterized protein LOC108458693 [Gossypium arboreum]
MDQRFEQLQKDMQDQLQEQLAKMQNDMREQMLEAQRNMMAEMAQLLRAIDKGKAPMAILRALPNPPPRRPSVTIMPQHGSIDTEIPMNFPTASGFDLGDNLANPIIPDLDMAEREGHQGVDAKDLSLVPDLVLPHKFKMPKFEKYNGTICPEAHITMFCRRVTGYVNNNQLLFHCFQDSLIGATARWYNQLSWARINSWRDLAQAFIQQYNHVTDMTPDIIKLQNIKKKPNESFRQYAQRWREIAMQVQPLLLEKETTMLFINTLKAPFITHMIGNTTKNFVDIVMAGEMIENAIRDGKIEGETAKRSTSRRNEVNNASNYNLKSATIIQPRAVTVGQQGPQRNESGMRQNSEKIQFTPIPVTYKELYQKLFDAHVVAPFYLEPMQPPYPKWYDANVQCEYHAGITGHFIENCTTFKKLDKKFTKMGVIKFDTENPLPNHSDQGVNVIGEDEAEQGNLKGFCPYKLESSLNNWKAEELLVVFRNYTK